MGAPWKSRFLLETIIFRAYVSFREGTSWNNIKEKHILPGTIISNPVNGPFESMIFLFLRVGYVIVSWRVYQYKNAYV